MLKRKEGPKRKEEPRRKEVPKRKEEQVILDVLVMKLIVLVIKNGRKLRIL